MNPAGGRGTVRYSNRVESECKPRLLSTLAHQYAFDGQGWQYRGWRRRLLTRRRRPNDGSTTTLNVSARSRSTTPLSARGRENFCGGVRGRIEAKPGAKTAALQWPACRQLSGLQGGCGGVCLHLVRADSSSA